MDWHLLKKLCDISAISGREENIHTLIKEKLKNQGFFIKRDYLGNLIAKISEDSKKSYKLVIDAHIDEVGMMVSRIDYGGFLRFVPVGGLSPEVLPGKPVLIHGKEKIIGIIGSNPPHLRSKDNQSNNQSEDLFIDTGLTNSEIREIVSLGDIITFMPFWYENHNSVMAKALDNRVGVFIILNLLEKIREIFEGNDFSDFDLYLVFSAQEESGMKGAIPISYMLQPDIVIVLEGTVANDIPGTISYKTLAQLGNGPEIRLSDSKFISSYHLSRFIMELAQNYNINHQVVVKKVGGTNAAAYQTGGTRGALTTAVSVPVRYIHSPVSLAHKEDIKDTYDLMEKILLENKKMLDLIIRY